MPGLEWSGFQPKFFTGANPISPLRHRRQQGMVPSASNGATTVVEFPGKSFEPVRSSSYRGQTPRKLRQVPGASSAGAANFRLDPDEPTLIVVIPLRHEGHSGRIRHHPKADTGHIPQALGPWLFQTETPRPRRVKFPVLTSPWPQPTQKR